MPSQEKIIPFYLHEMVENVINQIEEKNCKINQFQFEPLFINIFYCFYFRRFLSPYFRWRNHAMLVLKRNIKKKWLKCLPNIDFFIKQIEIKNKEVDPFEYWYHSEDYFEKIMVLKEVSDVLFPAKKKKNNKKKYFKVYKLIR